MAHWFADAADAAGRIADDSQDIGDLIGDAADLSKAGDGVIREVAVAA